MTERTIPRLFQESATSFTRNVLIWEKSGPAYHGITYGEVRERVRPLTAGLLGLGLKPGDRVGLISEGRPDWLVSELAVLHAGAVTVPVSVKIDEPLDLAFRLIHSECRMAVVSRSQLAKLRAVKPDLPLLENIVVLDPVGDLGPGECSLTALMESGNDLLQSRPGAFEAAWTAVKENDPANICYTSGTTADPKGIVLSHRNYTANVEHSLSLVECPATYVVLLILPWDHAFAHTCGIYGMMKNGAAIACVETGRSALETLRNIPKNIREVRPTVILSVPALARSFRKGIEKGIADKGPAAELIFRRGLKAALAYNGDGKNRGRGWRAVHKPLYLLADRLVFRKIRENFGGRLELFVGGGALLDLEMQRFFYALGMPMFQGYGLTEASPVISSNSKKEHKLGSSGKPASGIEVRIVGAEGRDLPAGSRGEIAVRGENVMLGYWRNGQATRETVRDGWLFTGDIGSLDEEGFLHVFGRTKSLLIANDGEKYSPEEIEEAVTAASPFIEQMMLYNDQSPWTVALVVPCAEAILIRLKERGLSPDSVEGQDLALGLIEGSVGEFKEGGRHAGAFPSRWLPSAVAVLEEGFTEKNGLLNSTMKMVRSRIAERHRARIDHLFSPASRSILNDLNRRAIARIGR